MRLYKCIALALAGLSIVPLAARAETISVKFNYADPNGIVSGNATLTGAAVPDDPGVYLATAGTLVVTAPSADNIAGTYSLVPNPSAPNARISPAGLFIYDNLAFPGVNPVVTNPGLLFFGGLAPDLVPEGQGREINFFSNGASTYDLYTGANGGYPYSFQFTTSPGSPAENTVTAEVGSAPGDPVAAPEPATWLIMGSFLLIALFKPGSRESTGDSDRRQASL